MKVYCTNLKCKYQTNKCTCKNKEIELEFNNVCTVNQGRQDFLKCKSFEKSDVYARLEERIAYVIGDKCQE